MTDRIVERTIQELKSLPSQDLQSKLLNYCVWLTILARMDFLDGNFDGAKDCNETLHRILGFLCHSPEPSFEEQRPSMIDMIVHSAAHKKRLQTLRIAFGLDKPEEMPS